MTNDVHDLLVASLPSMRIWARALTGNRAAADDLVQETAVKIIAAQQSFVAGTNFSAWAHRIMRNAFVSDIRKAHPTAELTGSVFDPIGWNHDDKVLLRELAKALERLKPEQRSALLMLVLEGKSYEEMAEITRCAEGTVKSRVHRARQELQAWLVGDIQVPSSHDWRRPSSLRKRPLRSPRARLNATSARQH
jgi:RNA polymerase sigma-70 factor, ECF subfamily